MKGFFTILLSALVIITSITSCGPTIAYSIRNAYTEDGGVASFGSIRLDGTDIPPVFTLVIAENNATFRFFQRTGPGGKVGYHPVSPLQVPRSGEPIARQDLDRGYYLGKARLAGTPEKWIYVAWDGGSAFALPRELYRLVKDRNLKPLPTKGQARIDI